MQVQASNGTDYDGDWSGSGSAIVCHEDMGALTLGSYSRAGSLGTDCLSENSPYIQYADYYARYYTFQIAQTQRVRVELSGALDNVPGGGVFSVDLVSGSGPKGTLIARDDSRIPPVWNQTSLQALTPWRPAQSLTTRAAPSP